MASTTCFPTHDGMGWSEASDFCHVSLKAELDTLNSFLRDLRLGNGETWVIRNIAIVKEHEAAFKT